VPSRSARIEHRLISGRNGQFGGMDQVV
jgi:hypothetical protein